MCLLLFFKQFEFSYLNTLFSVLSAVRFFIFRGNFAGLFNKPQRETKLYHQEFRTRVFYYTGLLRDVFDL